MVECKMVDYNISVLAQHYKGMDIVAETVKHKSGMEAMLSSEGIILTKLFQYSVNNEGFLLPNFELEPVEEIFSLWQRHHKQIPGLLLHGNAFCSSNSIEYFAANSEMLARHVGKQELEEFKQSGKYGAWNQCIETAESKLNGWLKNQLGSNSFEAQIRRFSLTLKNKNIAEKQESIVLVENDMKAIKEIRPFYRYRRRLYGS